MLTLLRSPLPWLALVPLLWVAGLAVSDHAVADDGPSSHATLRGFHATGEYDLYIAKKKQPAELLFSQRAASYLLVPDAGKSVYLIAQRARRVSLVEGTLIRHKNGDVDLPAKATLKSVGTATLKRGDIVLDAGSLQAHLSPRPPALGTLTGAEVKAHAPQYGLVMRGFGVHAPSIKTLKAAKGVSVEAFFGTWCSRCQSLLGHLLAVEDALGGQGISVSYYGLPAPPAAWKEAHYRAAGIKGLPAAVVRKDGKVIGRLGPADWKQVDQSIARLLGQR